MTPEEAAGLFAFEGEFVSAEKYGMGHINDTYLVRYRRAGAGETRYILQRVHVSIFKDPEGLMSNIRKVTTFLSEKIKESGGDPHRETMTLIPLKDGRLYLSEDSGDYWRAYLFIENATCFEKVEKPEDFYQSAYAFGRFQNLLSDFDATTLVETIKDFHNTPVRFARFCEVVGEDPLGRAKEVKEEIAFVMNRVADMHVCTDMQRSGELPLRVTHNDTKLNNVMIDDATGRGLCVIDLDTVMPGLSINDFGDSIRFGANTAVEDETDLSKVSLSIPLFEIYTKGFLEGCGGKLTAQELKMLPMGAKMMTMECGLRFLADYIEGDVYFKTDHPGHNLERARCQFALVEDMERKMDRMGEIVTSFMPQGN